MRSRAHWAERWRWYVTADHRTMGPRSVIGFALTGAALAFGALVGITLSVGTEKVLSVLAHPDWRWLGLAAGGAVVSYLGYLLAYREVAMADNGPQLPHRHAAAVVVTGFGLVIPRGGFSIDAAALADHGMPEQEAQQRVANLAVLEYAVLAPAAFVCALVLLLRHARATGGVLPSWVIGVPVGSVIAISLVLLRRRIGAGDAVRRSLSRGLHAIPATVRMLRTMPNGPIAAAGMALYWAADIAVLGACLAMVNQGHVSVAQLVVGYATGYALTRRSLPLGGSGAVEALLPFALYWVSVPLPQAVVAVLGYRIFNIWLIVAPSLVALRHLAHVREAAAAEREAAAAGHGPRPG